MTFFRSPVSAFQVQSVVSKATNYNLTLSDDYVGAQGNTVMQLPSAVNSLGKLFLVEKTDSNFNGVTVSSAAGLVGGLSQIILATQFDQVMVVSDGNNWQIVSHYIPGYWNAYTPGGSWSTNVVYSGFWRRIGGNIECQVKVLASGGAPGSGSLTVNIPANLSFDITQLVQSDTNTIMGEGSGKAASAGVKFHCVYNSTTSVLLAYQSSVTTAAGAAVTPTAPNTLASTDFVIAKFSGPIANWSA